ncbi:hypothetical protein [Gordonia sp. (in: high G+C Gram-positive bacteria)]|uniref:hypothetical protein n=1 Tax=Gordonia sp. (in: high G+C Gram-positive bacteria) TaxID=84139 RepID=UPI00352992CB
MTSISERYDYVVGVDTHAKNHLYAIIDARTGAVLARPEKFAVTSAGFTKALAWIGRHTAGARVLAGACQVFCVCRSGVRVRGDG